MLRALALIALLLPGIATAAGVTGNRGVATRSAVVRLDALPQAGQHAITGEAQIAVPLMSPPGARAVPPEAVRRARALRGTSGWTESAPPAAGPVVEAYPYVTGFLALDDDGARIPPDTHGAAGPAHLLVTLNSQVRVQDRDGTPLSTVTLVDFWSAVGPFTSVVGAFDPRSVYDPLGGRFITIAVADPRLAEASLLIGVSQTSDPTGAWNLYRVDADPADTTFFDFPSLGFNKDWIVVQVAAYSNADDAYRGSNVFAFDKADLYAGGAGTFTRMMDLSGAVVSFPASTIDAAQDTVYLVDSWNGNFSGDGYMRLSTITGSVGAEVLTAGTAFPSTSTPWASFGGLNFAPQLGSADGISVNNDRVGGVVFRDGSIWCAHTAFYPAAGPTRSSIQWWQIDPSGAVLQRGVVDDLSGNRFYGFPSIAVNRYDDVLIGYARFAETEYAGAGFSYRLGTDPPGTMRAEAGLKDGEDWYFKDFHTTVNRWGDYSATMVDPVDDVSFWTLQEYAAPRVSDVSYWGTWWGHVNIGRSAPAAPMPALALLGLALAGAAAAVLRRRRDARGRPLPSAPRQAR